MKNWNFKYNIFILENKFNIKTLLCTNSALIYHVQYRFHLHEAAHYLNFHCFLLWRVSIFLGTIDLQIQIILLNYKKNHSNWIRLRWYGLATNFKFLVQSFSFLISKKYWIRHLFSILYLSCPSFSILYILILLFYNALVNRSALLTYYRSYSVHSARTYYKLIS